ncbi:MAG: hypothetical protein ACLSDZ_02710 [Bifidobacterium sp.]
MQRNFNEKNFLAITSFILFVIAVLEWIARPSENFLMSALSILYMAAVVLIVFNKFAVFGITACTFVEAVVPLAASGPSPLWGSWVALAVISFRFPTYFSISISTLLALSVLFSMEYQIQSTSLHGIVMISVSYFMSSFIGYVMKTIFRKQKEDIVQARNEALRNEISFSAKEEVFKAILHDAVANKLVVALYTMEGGVEGVDVSTKNLLNSVLADVYGYLNCREDRLYKRYYDVSSLYEAAEFRMKTSNEYLKKLKLEGDVFICSKDNDQFTVSAVCFKLALDSIDEIFVNIAKYASTDCAQYCVSIVIEKQYFKINSYNKYDFWPSNRQKYSACHGLERLNGRIKNVGGTMDFKKSKGLWRIDCIIPLRSSK